MICLHSKGWNELIRSWLFKNYRKLTPPIIAFGLILLFISPISNRSSKEEDELIQPPSLTSIHPSPQEEDQQIAEDLPSTIMVDIKGMVKYPGVYELPSGARIVDVIEMAGGYLPESDSVAINHAQILKDEMAIYIPYKGEEGIVSSQLAPLEPDDGKININTADESLLTTLPGIGPSKAAAIIAYRDEQGLFNSPEELKQVTGIGDKTYERLQDSIKVR